MENKEDTRKQDHEKLKAQEMKDWVYEKTYTREEVILAYDEYTNYLLKDEIIGRPLSFQKWFDLNYPLNK